MRVVEPGLEFTLDPKDLSYKAVTVQARKLRPRKVQCGLNTDTPDLKVKLPNFDFRAQGSERDRLKRSLSTVKHCEQVMALFMIL